MFGMDDDTEPWDRPEDDYDDEEADVDDGCEGDEEYDYDTFDDDNDIFVDPDPLEDENLWAV